MNLNATQGSPYQGLTQTRPYDFGTDAIERQRVSLGQAMMDADFEYGLQATKWQSFYDIRKFPTFFEIPGTDATLSNVVSDGTYPYSNITVFYNNVYSQPQATGAPISIFGLSNPTKNADRAEGYYIITSNSITANTANYIAKGYVPSGNVQTNLTFSKRGGIYNSGTMNLQFSNLVTDGGSNIQVFTSNAHGILPGTPMTLATSNLQVNAPGWTANGTYFVCNVSSSNTFNLVSNTLTFKAVSTSNVANVSLYVNPFGSTQHRPYDGGVLLSTLAPAHGSTVLRQSKKAFRYQSGKGILFSSGTLFCPNLDIASMNLYGITTTLTSNSNGLTGVTLAVSQPALLGLNQNVTFSPATTNCFVTANVLAVSGSNVTFVYSNTFTNYLPTTVTQNVVTSTAYTPSSIPIQMANVSGFTTGSATIGALGSFTVSAVNSAAVIPCTSASTLPAITPFNVTLGNFGTYSVTSNNSGTALSISPSVAATVPLGTPVTYSNTSVTTAPTSTLTVQMSNTAGFSGSGYTVSVGNFGSYSVSSNTTSSITLSTWPSTIPVGTLISNSTVTGNLTTAGTTLALNSPTSNISGGVPFTVSIGSLGSFTVSSISSGSAMTLSTYPPSPLPAGTPVTYTSITQTSGPAYANLVFSTYPYSVPTGTTVTQGGSSNISFSSTTTPLNLAVASTNGFIIGETVTLTPAVTALGTLSVVSNASTTLGLGFSGTASTAQPVAQYTAVSGTPVAITGTVPITANIAGSQIFSNGQVVASYLGLNLGNVTITGTQTVASNAQVSLGYTGTFPPNGIPTGTYVTTLPPGSNIQIVTDISHGIPTTGATVTIRNVASSNINGTGYTITGVIDSHTVNVQSQSTITTTALSYGDQPRLVVTGWHGASVRAGIFDDPNGMFWEYDGQNLYVVRRQSTFQCAGYVTTSPGSQTLIGSPSGSTGSISTSAVNVNQGDTTAILLGSPHTITQSMYATIPGLGTVWVIGVPDYFQVQIGFLPAQTAVTIGAGSVNFSIPTTRFQDQLKVNDRFTIRGMTHQVTSIQGQGILTFNPPYRGASVIDAAHAVKACKIKELRIPQSQFNRDTMDGKGASGYKVDLSRMQMIGIQYTWYGAGFIDFMMRGPDGNWLYAHRIRNNNVNDEAYMRSGNLPVRYELSVEGRAAVTSLAAPVSNTLGTSASTTQSTDIISVNDATTYFPSSGTLLIDSELIYYSNATPNGFTGLTRAYPLTYIVNDSPRTFTGSANTTHYTGTSVNLISCSATPTLTHWGSSFLTDGQFDTERGYYFNYSNVTVNLNAFGGGANPASGSNACAFAIRLAPSVTNGLSGDIGQKELLNRAQLLLQKLEVTSPVNVQTVGFLNPTGISFLSNNWVNVNTPSNGTQPSFVQFYPGNFITGVPQPGERIFSTIVQANNQNNLDLSALKEMSNSVIGGNQNFPDGPDTLVVFCQNLTTSGGSNVIQVNLFWSEAQA